MSRKYKMNDIVPTNVLANRLEQLSDAVCKGPDEVRRQFDMRIPAELDRDADLVLSQSARRMTELEAQLAKVTVERDALKSSLAKRDLEQQAKGIDELLACRELDGFSQGAIDTIALIVNRLRKQSNNIIK